MTTYFGTQVVDFLRRLN